MATLENYKGLQVLDSASGTGGQAISDDFRDLVDWHPQSVWNKTVDPGASDDGSGTSGKNYQVGSLWLNTTTHMLFICTSNATGAATWLLLPLSFAVSATPTLNSNIDAGGFSISDAGTITATSFVGSGASLTGVALTNAANAFSVGGQTVQTTASVVPVDLRLAASQTANAFNITSHAGVLSSTFGDVFAVKGNGTIMVGGSVIDATNLTLNITNELILETSSSDISIEANGGDLYMFCAGDGSLEANGDINIVGGDISIIPSSSLEMSGPIFITAPLQVIGMSQLDAIQIGATSATDATTIVIHIDLPGGDSANYFSVTLGGNRTVGAPNVIPSGGYSQRITIAIKQPASGGPWTVSWNAVYRFSGGSAPSLTASASKVDIFVFEWHPVDSKWDCVLVSLNH